MDNEKHKTGKDWATVASLCFGVASVFLWEFSIVPVLAIVFGITGLVGGGKNRWKAWVGVALGIVFFFVRFSHANIDRSFVEVPSSNRVQQTITVAPQDARIITATANTASSSITNPDYLQNPSAYLVDSDNNYSSEVPTSKPLWVEEIIDGISLKVSYPVVKAGQTIFVVNTVEIPGLSYLLSSRTGDGKLDCREKSSIDFLTKKLLRTAVYLAFEGYEKVDFTSSDQTTTWRLLMPDANGKDTVDIARFVIWSGYGTTPFSLGALYTSNKSDKDFYKYPSAVHPSLTFFVPGELGEFAKDLKDLQDVARLAKRGFWGSCQ